MDVYEPLLRAEEILEVAPYRLLPIRQTSHNHADLPCHLVCDFEGMFRETSSAEVFELLAAAYNTDDKPTWPQGRDVNHC